MLGCADGKLRIKVAGTGKPASDLKVRIADGFGRSYGEQTISVQGREGESEIAIDLPPLPVGRFYADLWLKTGEKTQDWATVAFETGASRFADLALTSRALGADGEASGSFKLNKELGADEKIEVWLRDRNDRIVQKVPATVEGLKGTFAFKPRDMASAVLRPHAGFGNRAGKTLDHGGDFHPARARTRGFPCILARYPDGP
jgi:hypothetical protein